MKRLCVFEMCLVLSLLAFSKPGYCADHENLDQGLPTELEDAYPIAFGAMEVQGLTRYEEHAKSGDRFTLSPRFEAGVLPNTQVSLEVPVLMGSADREGSGDVVPSILYNLNTDALYMPAVSVEGTVRAPTGYHSDVTETQLKLLFTKALFPTSLLNLIHANITWGHLFNNGELERDNRLIVTAGYSQRLGSETVGIIDYVYEQDREQGQENNIIEAGLRYHLTPRTVISAGGGAGLTSESPDFKATAGFQYTF